MFFFFKELKLKSVIIIPSEHKWESKQHSFSSLMQAKKAKLKKKENADKKSSIEKTKEDNSETTEKSEQTSECPNTPPIDNNFKLIIVEKYFGNDDGPNCSETQALKVS